MSALSSLAVADTPPFAGWPAGTNARIISAPAKVNLFLELVRKRDDGYHDIATLMATVNLYDTLEIQARSNRDIQLKCTAPGIPTGPTNLVVRAAMELQSATGTPLGASIHLTKRIPHEAGLGGGSSDAAATLAALNALWKLNLTRRELEPIAAKIGSDVPFFLYGGAAWCTGRGEIVEPLPEPELLHLVLVKPAVGLSTAEVYRNVQLPEVPQTGEAIRTAFQQGKGNSAAIAGQLFNRLQSSAFGLQPLVATLYEQLNTCGPLGGLLSGSGSSLFALCRDRQDARRVASEFTAKTASVRPQCITVHTLGAMSYDTFN